MLAYWSSSGSASASSRVHVDGVCGGRRVAERSKAEGGGADRPSPFRRTLAGHLPLGFTASRNASWTSLGRSSSKVSRPMTEMPL